MHTAGDRLCDGVKMGSLEGPDLVHLRQMIENMILHVANDMCMDTEESNGNQVYIQPYFLLLKVLEVEVKVSF